MKIPRKAMTGRPVTDGPPGCTPANYDLFDHAPVPMWEEDFSRVRHHVRQLYEEGITGFRDYFGEHPEDVITLSEEVTLVRANKAAWELFEADENLASKPGTPRVKNKESFDFFRQVIGNLAEGQQRFNTRAIGVLANGRTRKVLLQYAVIPEHHAGRLHVCVAALEVSPQGRSEGDVRSVEEKYRQVIEFLDGGVILVDMKTRLVTEGSRQAGNVTHIRAVDMAGMHLGELFTADTVARYEAMLQDEPVSGVARFDGTVRNPYLGNMPVSIRARVIKGGGREYVVSVLEKKERPETGVVQDLAEDVYRPIMPEAAPRPLTTRELDVLRLISSGLTAREIGERLHISRKTVETHRARIMEKLNIHKAPELVRYALCCGLLVHHVEDYSISQTSLS